jgi:hypothetical protein
VTAFKKIQRNVVNFKNIANMFKKFIKFEHGVTHVDCVEEKKFEGQKMKKNIICRVPNQGHTAK